MFVSLLAPLLQRRGPDSPFGDLLGWIVVFFVIVWPILRGLMETAREQRKKFESNAPKAGPRKSGQGGPTPNRKARRTLEEILEGKLERVDSYDEPEEFLPEPPPRKPQRPSTKLTESKPAAFGDRPADEDSAPIYRFDDLQSESSTKLGADPFDESSMDSDLVPEAKLSHVPTEDELESDLESTMDGITRRPAPAAAARPVPAAGGMGPGLLRSDDPEVIFRKMGRPLSPWQKAFILKEVLGDPLASRPLPTLDDFPG
jgi:hypothetical protein